MSTITRLGSLGWLLLVAPVPLPAQARPYWLHTADPIPLQCQPSVAGLVWQWRTNASTGDVKKESPLYSLSIGMTQTRDKALKTLQHGQRHNHEAQRVYGSCAYATGGYYILFLAAAVSDVSCNSAQVRDHFAWIYSHAPAGILNAITNFDRARSLVDPDEQDAAVLRVYTGLLSHQRHNPDALAVIRACFHDQPTSLFDIARQVVH